MDAWDEVRTAYHVARLGTVSGAADYLSVHHATVIRHIDALEGRLGVRLFHRHARGYTPTEAGQDLLATAAETEARFSQLASRIAGQGDTLSGELVLTALGFVAQLLMPALAELQNDHPDLRIRLVTDERVFRMELGEAHIAIRAGSAPSEPDNVVQPFFTLRARLCATKSYLEQHGPFSLETAAQHRFVATTQADSRAPFLRWLKDHVPEDAIVFRASDFGSAIEAVHAGIGIGFAPAFALEQNADLVEVMPSLDEWNSSVWLVTHVDLHRSPKVQRVLAYLKDNAKNIVGTV